MLAQHYCYLSGHSRSFSYQMSSVVSYLDLGFVICLSIDLLEERDTTIPFKNMRQSLELETSNYQQLHNNT